MQPPMLKPHTTMSSISPVTASLYAQDTASANLASTVGATIEHTILQEVTQSVTSLLDGLSTSGSLGRHINALA